MYLKIIGGMFLIGSAASIGCLKAEELKERVEKLQELKRMTVLLQGELRFHRATLSEAFENTACRIEEPFASFLRDIAEKLEMRDGEHFDDLWIKMSEKLLETGDLKKEDVHLLELLGSGLGYLDLTMQMESLNLVVLRTEETIVSAKEQQRNKGRLYQTTGITVGALLTLLMI